MPYLRMPDDLFVWVVIGMLATWRITSIIHSERIAAPFRKLFGVQETDDAITAYPDTFFGHLIECSWCISIWVGGLVAIIWLIAPVILVPFAFSTVAILVQEYIHKG